jgi:pimeloyl-ACP methyl ester carboxylesterase
VPARLHHERIGDGDRRLLLTHGIYGAGSNWRAIARKLVGKRPEWSVELVDLRQHGKSDPGDPPHTLAACADDIIALAGELGDVRALAGHSFGGKVMLAAHAHLDVPVFVFDASPSPRPGALTDGSNSVVRVLALMERLPATWAKREDFVAAVTAEGHSPALAQWLAMNVIANNGGYVLRLDLVAIRELLASYFATDLWPAVDPRTHIVIAARSSALSAADRARVATTSAHVHTIDADHWLHIEAPAAVVDLLAAHLA